MLYTVRGLQGDTAGVDIRVRILWKGEPRKVRTKDGVEHLVVEALVGDRTGTLTLALWDDCINMAGNRDVVDIKNGYVNRFKGRLRLNIGMYGSIEKVEDPSFPTVEEISTRHEQRRLRRRSS